jgi:hypothetical protein
MELQPIEHQTQRILTTAQIAAAYGTDERRISENFNRNKERYTSGKHYFLLEGHNLKAFGDHYANCVSVERASKLYLWTEKGALMHAKSLNTDKAWEIYEWLVDDYYRPTRQELAHTPSTTLRKRALVNETRVPDRLFATPVELSREITYWERIINETLDNGSSLENSVGQHWSRYARTVLRIPDEARRKYNHVCPNGRTVQAWAYPIEYLPAFRRWLSEVYFPEHFPAYARYRAKRIGANLPDIKQITSGVKQLALFPVA